MISVFAGAPPEEISYSTGTWVAGDNALSAQPPSTTAENLAAVSSHRKNGTARIAGVSLRDELYAGLDGLRLLVAAARRLDRDAVDAIAAARQPEWNVLVPGSFPQAPPLSQQAATCSERRLHAESHQVYRVINAARDAVLAAAGPSRATFVIRGAGRLDVPSMRGMLRFAEPASDRVHVVLADLLAAPTGLAPAIQAVRQRLWQAFLARLRLPVLPGGDAAMPAGDPSPPSAERDWTTLSATAASAADRIAACLVAMRAAFLTTNYPVGMRAASQLLTEVESASTLDVARIRAALAQASFADDPGSIGLGPAEVIDIGAVRSLAHRYLGMTAAFVLDYPTAERHFGTAIEAATTPPLRARALLLRALLRVKRLGHVEDGFADVQAGLSLLSQDPSDEARIEAAWLFNVSALGHVTKKDSRAATSDEQQAIRLIGGLTSTDATHLKVNLVSNMSVLAEQSGQYAKALAIWQRFSRVSDAWGDMFFKNHAYREGNLLARLGRTDEALTAFEHAYECAVRTGDDFYAAHMALGCGGHLIKLGRPKEALPWYEAADGRARALGDDYLTALAMLGAVVAHADGGRVPAAELAPVLDLAQRATSYPVAAAALAAALADPDLTDLTAALPTVLAKLNRPFTPVRLDLTPLT